MQGVIAQAIVSAPGRLHARGYMGLVALAALGAVLVVGAGISLMLHEDTAGAPRPVAQVKSGGETVIAKFARARAQTGFPFPEPTPVNRLLSMALAPFPTTAPQDNEEPNLAGLSEIPRELIWNRPQEEEEEDEKRPKSSFAEFSKAQEQLPWDAVEPVPFSTLESATDQSHTAGAKKGTSATTRPPIQLASAEISNWLKAKVTKIKGADRSRPLYHFELWLEPPATVKGRLVGVAYAFSTPAIRPQSQDSSDRASGFRISAGGLACADEIVLTLRFDNGSVEKATVDGCKLLS